MDKKWWHNSVVYQIYPRSFMDSNHDGIGDIQGIISKLDYLQNLGVDVIWLSPVYASPMDDNGYDISDYRTIAPEFGTMDDMDFLLSKSKAHGIKILMDLVVNHTSDEHPWFMESQKSKDNPYRDYYIWREPKSDGSPPSEMESIFSGSAWEYHPITDSYYFHLFSKKQPDLNWDNPKVRHEIYAMMNWWLDKDIGGFRMDVIDLIGKDIDKGITGNGPNLHPYLQEMYRATFGLRDVLTVGETWGASPDTAKMYSNPSRLELSMIFQFDHITLFWDPGFGKWKPQPFNMISLKKSLSKWQTALGNEGWNSLFWNNHDLPRVVSKFGNPDNYHRESATMLATLLHLQKGTPYIYQGEEIGMTNVHFNTLSDYNDIETLNFYTKNTLSGMTHDEMMQSIWENSRDNARTPMQWDNTLNSGFSSHTPWLKINPNYKTINVSDTLAKKQSIFYYYQSLIQLRKKLPVIVYGDYMLLYPDDPQIFAFIRSFTPSTDIDGLELTIHDISQKLLVINNFSEKKAVFKNECSALKSLLLSNYYKDSSAFVHLHSQHSIVSTITLEPYESLVFEIY